ncbi:hypothetical protein ONS95_011886 [Cadophora gregata]|uniref:uncharacterized protein n=1 Tax=Cadophora gregata TaxID=51156 RepID=UPI0026DDA6C7|nr:uncharacterized protein ONS95_011886 [Cadophora gregata]KAK0117548.1 hypothetical protein ONS95_011886 [Cadophora gregata]
MSKDIKASALDTLYGLEEPLVDTTAAIPLHSKRTERRQKKRHLKEKSSKQHATLWDLPSELITDILTLLKPSDIFRLSRVNRPLRGFIQDEEGRLCRKIVAKRYAVLSQCFPLPVLLENVDEEIHPAMLSDERQAAMNIHKRPYQHIQPPDQYLICTCLTCMLAWNNLNLVVDFSHWQKNLEEGEPIPMIARGKSPRWNQKLTATNAEVVEKALRSSLWHARILECHLKSTIGSIRRHGNNKGNKRRRFLMSADDAKAETDLFLERSGPPSLDFPFHRDNYYMLEAYLPNRGWNAEFSEWRYMPASQHDRDIEFVQLWAKRRLGQAEVTEKVEKAVGERMAESGTEKAD